MKLFAVQRRSAMAAAVAVVGLLSVGAHAETKLQRIFTHDVLNAELPYLEGIAGPAMHVSPTATDIVEREYRVDGCKVVAGVKDGKVRSLSLKLTPKCNFSMAAILGNSYPNTRGITLAKFAAHSSLNELKPTADCLYSCGNSQAPTVQFTWHGAHVFDFIDVILDVVIYQKPSLDAEQRWTDYMRAHGETNDTLIAQHYLCTEKYDAEGRRAFSNVAIDTVHIGFDIKPDLGPAGGCPK